MLNKSGLLAMAALAASGMGAMALEQGTADVHDLNTLIAEVRGA